MPSKKQRKIKFTAAAEAVAACYTKKELEMIDIALDTALEDSYEWGKQSDEGDDSREKESNALDKIAFLISTALNIKDDEEDKTT